MIPLYSGHDIVYQDLNICKYFYVFCNINHNTDLYYCILLSLEDVKATSIIIISRIRKKKKKENHITKKVKSEMCADLGSKALNGLARYANPSLEY